jgi:plastocyanin
MERRTQMLVGLGVIAVLGVGAVLLTTDSGDDDDGDDVPAEETVETDGQAYAPDTFTVVEGEYVRFVNNDDVAHTFTADDGLFDSGTVEPGDDFRYAFDGPITVAYHCEIHPSMTGEVTVTAS